MKKKALLTLTAVMLGLFCLTSCQSQEERTISKLEQLSERIEENGDKYDVEDWNGIMKEMESISDDIEDCDLTNQQMKEVGRLQAKFYKAVMKNGKKIFSSGLSKVFANFGAYAQGLKEGLQIDSLDENGLQEQFGELEDAFKDAMESFESELQNFDDGMSKDLDSLSDDLDKLSDELNDLFE